MQTNALYREMLGLQSPWKVSNVQLSLEKKHVTVLVDHCPGKEFPCPICGIHVPIYDHTPVRTWRHLDSDFFSTLVTARIPRVACLLDGVRQTEVPWALPRAQFSLAFESWAIDVLRVKCTPLAGRANGLRELVT